MSVDHFAFGVRMVLDDIEQRCRVKMGMPASGRSADSGIAVDGHQHPCLEYNCGCYECHRGVPLSPS